MQNLPQQELASQAPGLSVPTREQALEEAMRHLARPLNAGDLVWIVGQQYDPQHVAWVIDLVRRGPMARWVRQRYRYDAQAATLYFLGERTLSDAEFGAARRSGTLFPVAQWQK